MDSTTNRLRSLPALLSVLGLVACAGKTAPAGSEMPAGESPGETAPSADVRIGYCTGDVEKAKAGGFDFAELGVRNFAAMSDEEFATFLAKHKEVGLPTPVGNVFLPGEIKVVGPEPTAPAEQMAYVQKAFDRAQQLGLEIIVFGSGGSRKVPDGFSKDQAFEQLVEFAKRIAPEAQKRNITLAVEPLQTGETNTINSAAEGLKWVKAVDHPNFRLMVDFYHLSLEKEDPAILVEAAPYLMHIHIANPEGRVFPQDLGEYDYSKFFQRLREINYQGGISVEAKAENYEAMAPKAISLIRTAWQQGAADTQTN